MVQEIFIGTTRTKTEEQLEEEAQQFIRSRSDIAQANVSKVEQDGVTLYKVYYSTQSPKREVVASTPDEAKEIQSQIESEKSKQVAEALGKESSEVTYKDYQTFQKLVKGDIIKYESGATYDKISKTYTDPSGKKFSVPEKKLDEFVRGQSPIPTPKERAGVFLESGGKEEYQPFYKQFVEYRAEEPMSIRDAKTESFLKWQSMGDKTKMESSILASVFSIPSATVRGYAKILPVSDAIKIAAEEWGEKEAFERWYGLKQLEERTRGKGYWETSGEKIKWFTSEFSKGSGMDILLWGGGGKILSSTLPLLGKAAKPVQTVVSPILKVGGAALGGVYGGMKVMEFGTHIIKKEPLKAWTVPLQTSLELGFMSWGFKIGKPKPEPVKEVLGLGREAVTTEPTLRLGSKYNDMWTSRILGKSGRYDIITGEKISTILKKGKVTFETPEYMIKEYQDTMLLGRKTASGLETQELGKIIPTITKEARYAGRFKGFDVLTRQKLDVPIGFPKETIGGFYKGTGKPKSPISSWFGKLEGETPVPKKPFIPYTQAKGARAGYQTGIKTDVRSMFRPIRIEETFPDYGMFAYPTKQGQGLSIGKSLSKRLNVSFDMTQGQISPVKMGMSQGLSSRQVLSKTTSKPVSTIHAIGRMQKKATPLKMRTSERETFKPRYTTFKIPKTKTPAIKFGSPFKWRKKKKMKGVFSGFKFGRPSARYSPSVVAGVYNIRGSMPKFYSGLGVRPILKKKRRLI